MTRPLRRALLAAAAIATIGTAAFAAEESAMEKTGKNAPPQYKEIMFPPWQHGAKRR